MGLIGRVWAEISGDASGLKRASQEGIDALNKIKNASDEFAKSQAMLESKGLLGKMASDVGLHDYLKSLEKDSKDAGKSLNSFSMDVITLNQALALINRGVRVAKQSWEFITDGARLSSLEQASGSLAQNYGANMDKIVSAVKKVSMDTITEYDIMQGANLAMTMGISANADEIANLMQIAIQRGRAFGLTATDAFDRITRGIGRKRAQLLDDLGFTADAIAANKEYASSLGISTKALSDEMEVRALFEQILKQGNAELSAQGGLVMDLSTPYQQASTTFSEFVNTLKLGAAYLALPAFASPEQTAELNKQAAAYSVLNSNYEGYIAAKRREARFARRDQFGRYTDFETPLTREQFDVAQRWTALYRASQDLNTNIKEYTEYTNDANIATEVQAGLAGEVEKAYQKYNDVLDEYGEKSERTIVAAKEMQASISELMFTMANASDTINLSGEAQLKLSTYFDLNNEKSQMMQAAMTALNEKYDANKDGVIELSEMTWAYMADLGALAAMFTDKTANWTLIIDVIERGGSGTFPNVRSVAQKLHGMPENVFRHGGSIIGAASGMSAIIPPGFSNDTAVIGVSSGERVDVTPAGNKSVKGSGVTNKFYGNVTFKIDKDHNMSNFMESLRV